MLAGASSSILSPPSSPASLRGTVLAQRWGFSLGRRASVLQGGPWKVRSQESPPSEVIKARHLKALLPAPFPWASRAHLGPGGLGGGSGQTLQPGQRVWLI